MTTVHIYAPAHYYLAQVRGIGCRNWRSLPDKYKYVQTAMCAAIMDMHENDKRARVLMIARDGYLDPIVVMEANK